MAWNEAVITNAGLNLYAEGLQGYGIKITKAIAGSEVYPPLSLLLQTDVTAPHIKLNLIGVFNIPEGKRVDARLDNINIEEPFIIRQVGIFAKKSDGESEILLAIIQDETGIEVPSIYENPEFILEFGFLLPFPNELQINAVLAPTELATLGDLSYGFQNRPQIFLSEIEPREWLDDDWWYEEIGEAQEIQSLEIETVPFNENQQFHIETDGIHETRIL